MTSWRVICCKCPIPSDGPSIQSMRDRPSPAFGEKAECVMKFAIRFRKWRKCGQLNKTIALHDAVKCDFCTEVSDQKLNNILEKEGGQHAGRSD